MNQVTVSKGHGPIILGLPHGGTEVPDDIRAKLNDNGRRLADTDWHIGELYEGLRDDVTVVAANFHRYVIDANRDPSGASLYPGQNTTGLCPVSDFDGRAIYKTDAAPDDVEVAARLAKYHAPYHAALAAEVERVRARHGVAIVYDCHSIRSQIPFLFDGILPHINIGTDEGRTCAPHLQAVVHGIAASSSFSSVLNGRFRGGWTTRHYGKPQTGVHAIQMEIAQAAYLESEAEPWTFSRTKAQRLRPVLKDILDALATAAQAMKKDHNL